MIVLAELKFALLGVVIGLTGVFLFLGKECF